MGQQKRFTAEFRERAVRMVLEHQGEFLSQWAAIKSVSSKMGCSPEALRRWTRMTQGAERPAPMLTEPESDRLKRLERENFELRRANEILRKAAAFFAQAELDRREK